ncbi:hypothetical protein CPB85DRAFT_1305846 [Mucidula mucida]|nr:hypothetical protein CPB85DRAFT_1305846 [Mucidula mucida]
MRTVRPEHYIRPTTIRLHRFPDFRIYLQQTVLQRKPERSPPRMLKAEWHESQPAVLGNLLFFPHQFGTLLMLGRSLPPFSVNWGGIRGGDAFCSSESCNQGMTKVASGEVNAFVLSGTCGDRNTKSTVTKSALRLERKVVMMSDWTANVEL